METTICAFISYLCIWTEEEKTKSVSFFICDLWWFFVVFLPVFLAPMFFSIWICFCSNIVSPRCFLHGNPPPFISLQTSLTLSPETDITSDLYHCELWCKVSLRCNNWLVIDPCIGQNRKCRSHFDLKSCFYFSLSPTLNMDCTGINWDFNDWAKRYWICLLICQKDTL